MRDRWLAFGCFLTGYNYKILKNCSEAASRRVLRYTSAMIIPCVLWAFVGFFFTSRYLKLGWEASVSGAVIMIIIVIQIERQVILSTNTNRLPLYFRGVIAFFMAIIGSLIIDQVLFKDDIEKQRLITMDNEVREVLPARSAELKRQIHEIDSTIASKEEDRRLLLEDIAKNPKIRVYSKEATQEKIDTVLKEVVKHSSTEIQNPKIALLEPLDGQLASLRTEKLKKDSMLLVLRPLVEAELKDKVGFLDELELMFSIIKKSNVALGVWLLWFFFLSGIEVFILISKFKERETDYDVVVNHQEALHLKRIDLLTKM